MNPSKKTKPLLLLVVVTLLATLCGAGFAQTRLQTQAQTFETFDWARAKTQAKALSRPRSFPAGAETTAVFAAATTGDRKAGFTALTARLNAIKPDSRAAGSIAAAKGAQSADDKARIGVTVKNAVYQDAKHAQEAGFAALVTGSAKYREDAMRLMLALAALDPKTDTSVAKEGLSAMLVTRTLALGLDWFYANWTEQEKRQLVDAISVRMEDFAVKLVHGPTPLEKNPLVSIENEVIGGVAETAVLLLGTSPLADRWFDEFVPLYARLFTPFGGADGGYANGTTYASWDIGEYSLRHWDTLRRAIGLDLTTKPWAQNFGRYLAYFLPPGTPAGAFGDGAEVAMLETWARYAKAYAYRVPTPLNRWYAAQWFQEDPARLELLTSPVMPPAAATYPVDTADAALFPSIGWVALHSSLQNRSRTSLYFKSSPYGSISHSHADQNSFVLNTAGRRLLVDSGYYDYFASPHHYGWTKRTVAHNAVTFDGGLGQDDPARPWGLQAASGKITEFSTTPQLDVTVGDATPAYRGQLTQATRGIAYFRPNTYVIFDSLESSQPRKWEWNLHALGKFVQDGGNSLVVSQTDAKACIRFQASTPTTFQQSSAFPAPPARTPAEPRPDQWHGQYVTQVASTRFWSVAVISMDCAVADEIVQFNPTSATVRMAGRELSYNGKTIVTTSAKGAP